ncbi:hypothetical protein V6N13_141585 [Hibiscus sabdariffa]
MLNLNEHGAGIDPHSWNSTHRQPFSPGSGNHDFSASSKTQNKRSGRLDFNFIPSTNKPNSKS